MTQTGLFILTAAAASLVAFTLIDAAKDRDGYHDLLTECYFDEGCTLNPREYRRFIEQQKRDLNVAS